MSILVGEVIAVRGVKVSIKVFESSNKDTLFYDGTKYKGVSIREYVQIERGFKKIICIVEGEYLDEKRVDDEQQCIRTVDLKPIGYFESGRFFEGIKHLPLIKDPVYLLEENKLSDIYGNVGGDFVIGKLLKEEFPVSLPWQKLFNTHIGIFGNTGSGKSNTLTNLYTTLFDKKIKLIKDKSQFVIIDFNGEYTNGQLTSEQHKRIYTLNTRKAENKFPLAKSEFWDTDTLSLLFQATQNTQKPFINRIVKGKQLYDSKANFLNYIKTTYEKVFTTAAPHPELLDLIRGITSTLGNEKIKNTLKTVAFHGTNKVFYTIDGTYFNADGAGYRNRLRDDVDAITIPKGLSNLDQFSIRCHIQLIRDLISGYVQFDFIQPLLKRIESSLTNLTKVIRVTDTPPANKAVTVISLRKCNQDIKKVMPLLVAKHYYNPHKTSVANPPDKTIHLIIDEAHNILSQQSNRESESWKDYRLETFEEIIKEGRKFGMFLTLSSQRPADISPTIVSQIHNFFIHRLVNDRDLFLIDNTISTLDSMSRSMIPNLSRGSCVITGTAFDLPMLLQVDELAKEKQPDSEDVDLEQLWSDD
ncbi:ATP-binding protein [Vibrio parahaemolyticus]|uniref:ATP-binding protein n=1 Tax=Vibrio diabolicus TaxID=50719 RepID=A0AAX1XI01_9VIBR|nr:MULTISPECIES: ATP-binding protein [Vibrio harveyi group]EIE1195744.1 ATP-binding protein [Vibrio parahaemolyticus]EIU6845880.1 ATP-binding protein [Vibrio parahaemolyticus]EJC6986933.1 ATP-binding protein [Vibrio parahaemolyticus]EJG1901235.1 ATP-binding protein [Vibrio parahaemolyticus]EKB1978450.1 ATP-binding protein [Vibrio parahaemolyticus]